MEFKRWRCELHIKEDLNLIAKFVLAISAQEAMVQIKKMYGPDIFCSIKLD